MENSRSISPASYDQRINQQINAVFEKSAIASACPLQDSLHLCTAYSAGRARLMAGLKNINTTRMIEIVALTDMVGDKATYYRHNIHHVLKQPVVGRGRRTLEAIKAHSRLTACYICLQSLSSLYFTISYHDMNKLDGRGQGDVLQTQ
ncbi:hypothetical protein J6590_091507 [Homalodisca vitripennis]|nr:hypothetical protein J6590_091507 [Homalodisca vitripennis]